MTLTKKQEEGLKIAVERYKRHEKYCCISGYAGTGKSTLVKFIIDALGLDPDYQVAYASFTGKASEVLRKKGCPNATTAHKLLYYADQKQDGSFVFRPRKYFEKPYKVVVIDEISMLPKDMWDLLMTHKTYVLACGDPFQIPPIQTETDNHVLDHPHIFLDEIMRQAKESGIIRLSMTLREMQPLQLTNDNDVKVIDKKDLITGMYNWADQIICSTNKTRKEINQYMRSSMNFDINPQIGDKVICLQNSKYAVSNLANPIVNGTIGYLTSISVQSIKVPYWIKSSPLDLYLLDLDADEEFYQAYADKQLLDIGTETLTIQNKYKLYHGKNAVIDMPQYLPFEYGYAITGHRAQGSQWNKVLVIEEGFPYPKEEHFRHLYTSATRAAEKLIIVRY